MNVLHSVEIKGLWGQKAANLILNRDVNFLIGPNGSGKTTIINTIVAALTADARALLQTPFEEVQIRLNQIGGSRRPSIRVVKQAGERSAIQYFLKSSANATPIEYRIEEPDDRLRYHLYNSWSHRFPSQIEIEHPFGPLRQALSELFDLTWLSIHRAKSFRRQNEEDAYDSTVDQKLGDLSNEFVRFFSGLSQAASQEMHRFQETVFLALLIENPEEMIRDAARPMDIKAEKDALAEIYNELNVSPEKFQSRMESHFKGVATAIGKFHKGKDFGANDFTMLIMNLRIQSIVQDWNEVTARQTEIFEPRNTFLSVIHGLMEGKKFEINDRNELTVKVNGNPLPLSSLSSGEKQMVIILGEALLQDRSPSIYIADEPELSLHVDWQEALVRNIRLINPEAQILFATHSPDIVGGYSKNLFDVKDYLQ